MKENFNKKYDKKEEKIRSAAKLQGLVNFGKNVGKFKKKEKINSALTRRARCCRGGSRHERKGGMEAERIRKKENINL